MCVGVMSQNVAFNVDDNNRMVEDPCCEWTFDLMAKKTVAVGMLVCGRPRTDPDVVVKPFVTIRRRLLGIWG